MRKKHALATQLLTMIVIAVGGNAALAVVTSSTSHGPSGSSLDGQIRVGDLLSGLIPTELAGDLGWHPANPATANGSLDPHGLPAFTDDVGGSGLYGLLNDNSPGVPVKKIRYDFAGPTDFNLIQILTGNDGLDGRVFSTTVISTSTDGSTFNLLGYFQSDPSGTINSGQWGSTLVKIFDDAGGPMATGVTNIEFDFYSVDNTQGEMRDPFDGVNSFTGVDDGYTAGFQSPLVWEIDVAVPEPSTAILAGCGLALALGAIRRGR